MSLLSLYTCHMDRRIRYQFIHLCCFVVVSSLSSKFQKCQIKTEKNNSREPNAIWPRLFCVWVNFFSLSFLWHSIEIKSFVRNFIEFFHIILVDFFFFLELSIHNRLSLFDVRAHVFPFLSINVCHVYIVVFVSFSGLSIVFFNQNVLSG